MESQSNKKEGRVATIRKFLNSRPKELPTYGKFKIKDKVDKETRRLLRLEASKIKKTKVLLCIREQLITLIELIDNTTTANCCTIYKCWMLLNKGLPRKK